VADGFEATVLPRALVVIFALSLPYLELVIGVLLILGAALRPALIAGALLMAALMFGTALQGNWDVLGIQVLYALVLLRAAGQAA
jgi:thiosulfate dehydrogenase [quinone] large subunit